MTQIGDIIILMNSFFPDLESEMYQLSHLLIEQRNILSTLREQNATEKTRDVLLDEPEKGELFKKSVGFQLENK